MEDVVLEVYREHRPGVIQVTLAGEMDEGAVARLQEELERLRSVLVKTIVVDLRRARGVRADAVSVVAAGVVQAEETGQRVVVVREPGTLPRLDGELAALDVRMDPEPSMDGWSAQAVGDR